MRLFEKPFEEFERGNNILTSPGCQFFGWACWRTGWSSWSSRLVPENWRRWQRPTRRRKRKSRQVRCRYCPG